MSDKPIVGKWAVVYKPWPCCKTPSQIHGLPHVVPNILDDGTPVQCPYCKTMNYGVQIESFHPDRWYLSVMAKRLPDPPAELTELEQIKEDVEQLVKEHQ